jgi:hypothetical protein
VSFLLIFTQLVSVADDADVEEDAVELAVVVVWLPVVAVVVSVIVAVSLVVDIEEVAVIVSVEVALITQKPQVVSHK